MKRIALISACLLVFASCSPQAPSEKETSITNFSYRYGVATWDSYEGLGVQVKGLNDENFTTIKGKSYEITKSDLYTFKVKAGLDSGKNIKYVESDTATKYVVAGVPGNEQFVIEDGEEEDAATLAEKYRVTKYDDTAKNWVESSATIVLDDSNEGISDGHCVRMGYKHHGTYFKYDQTVDIPYSYNTLSFYVKGEEGTYFSLAFQVLDHIVINEIDFAGVFFSYQVNPASRQWQKYTVSMDDPNWKIDFGGSKMSLAQVQQQLSSVGCFINSIGDLFPLVNQFQFRVGATYNNNGSDVSMRFDEVALSNTNITETDIHTYKEHFDMKPSYAVKSDSFTGTAAVEGNNITLNLMIGNQAKSLNATLSDNADHTKSMVCNEEGFDFNATIFSLDGAKTIEIEEITGTAANAFKNFKCEQYEMLDDFSAYTETGFGYDANHAKNARTGMRANYFCDYYSEGTGNSPVGGNNWHLMGSTDYMDFVNTMGHNDSKCARLKYRNDMAMRYMTYSLSDEEVEGHPFSGKWFSFWAKGTDHAFLLKISVYSISTVTPSTQQTNRAYMENVEVPANADWFQIRVQLDPKLTYYGYSITTTKNGGSNPQYFYVDDFNVYGNVSPWSN